MNTSLRIAAAIAVLLFSAGAQARHHQTTIKVQSCGVDHGVSLCPGVSENGATAQRGRGSRRAVASRTAHGSGQVERSGSVASLAETGGSGVIRSAKTGATATGISPRYQPQFQALLDDFEAHGATVYYMGARRSGSCSLASQHPCGWAVDFCQDSYGHVSGARDCHLPLPAEFHDLVVKHGLFDGSVWCHSDYGHVQAKDSGGCNVAAHGSWGHGSRRYLASMTGAIEFAGRRRPSRHHRTRYARR